MGKQNGVKNQAAEQRWAVQEQALRKYGLLPNQAASSRYHLVQADIAAWQGETQLKVEFEAELLIPADR